MQYEEDATREISFPLGGIGSGSIGLAGNGRFVDWEIFNRPSKGSINGHSHFAIKAIRNHKAITYVLNGDLKKDLVGQYEKATFRGYGFGPSDKSMCGFPHFRQTEFLGEFPVASIQFRDDNFPAEVKLTAFNPFIPNDEDNSSIPAAFFEIEVTNAGRETIEYQIAFSVTNPFPVSENEGKTESNRGILKLYHAGVEKNHLEYGDLCVATDCEDVHIQTYRYMAALQFYRKEFAMKNEIKRVVRVLPLAVYIHMLLTVQVFAAEDMLTVANRIIIDAYNKIAGASTALAALITMDCVGDY